MQTPGPTHNSIIPCVTLERGPNLRFEPPTRGNLKRVGQPYLLLPSVVSPLLPGSWNPLPRQKEVEEVPWKEEFADWPPVPPPEKAGHKSTHKHSHMEMQRYRDTHKSKSQRYHPTLVMKVNRIHRGSPPPPDWRLLPLPLPRTRERMPVPGQPAHTGGHVLPFNTPLHTSQSSFFLSFMPLTAADFCLAC